MSALRGRIRSESGQAFVFVAFMLVFLVGMAAIVVDAGFWYREDRQLQTAVDAAALAGAQDLPEETTAESVARDEYAPQNGSGLNKLVVTADASSSVIDVTATAKAPGIFARIFEGLLDEDGEVTIHANAQAQVQAPLELKNVAPIAVHVSEACIVTDPGCFGDPKTLTFAEGDPFDPTKSKFGLLDLNRDGSAGAGDMKDWLENGYPDPLTINTDYPPANGEKNGIKQELEDAADEGRVLLFPVFDSASAATGYHIIGWAAFVIEDVIEWTGHDHEFTGHFVTFIATDLAAGGTLPDPADDFGVHVITLTK
jgi:Flp pilus assembly protein TadG